MDFSTSTEVFFDQGFWDIYIIRIAGNVLNDDILGSMEVATKVVGTKVIFVLVIQNVFRLLEPAIM